MGKIYYLLILISLLSFSSAFLGNFPQEGCVNIKVPSNCSSVNLSFVETNQETFVINTAMDNLGGQWFNYTFCDTDYVGEYRYAWDEDCVDCSGGLCGNNFEITVNGKPNEDSGNLSSSILYFFLLLGLGLNGLGFLFLKNNSLWIKYSGLFIMLIGFAFLYYDLHLTNVYATTIAYNSGAGTVATGAFLMIVRFIKLAPYIVAGVIAFSAIAVLRKSIKARNSGDGWDNNIY